MGFMRNSTVGLVTPVRDGMNLVAKEYIAAQDPDDPGVLVLSSLAGAAVELTDALLVNPNDIRGVAAAVLRDARSTNAASGIAACRDAATTTSAGTRGSCSGSRKRPAPPAGAGARGRMTSSAPQQTTTTPPFMTHRGLSSTRTSVSGSPGTATRSANTRPHRADPPSMRSSSRPRPSRRGSLPGVIPASTNSLNWRAFRPCGWTPLSVRTRLRPRLDRVAQALHLETEYLARLFDLVGLEPAAAPLEDVLFVGFGTMNVPCS
jgi:hypothetical protein